MIKSSDARLRHIRHYLGVAENNRHEFHRLDQEQQNIMAAANYCLQIQDWQLLTALTNTINHYLLIRSRKDYITFNTSLITNDLAEQPAEKIVRLNQLVKLEESQGNYSQALVFSEWLIPLYKQSGDVVATIEALQRVSRLSRVLGKHEMAYEHLKQGIILASEHGYSEGRVDLFHDCAIFFEKQDSLLAQRYCEVAIDNARSCGYLPRLVDLLVLQASLFLDHYELRPALHSAGEALDIANRMSDIARTNNISALLSRLGRMMGRNIFISYNHQDKSFVERLANDLKAAGLPVWWDQWEIKVGESIIQKVSDGIDSSAYLIAVLSPYSVDSKWVQREIGSAIMEELSEDRGISILPLLAAECEIPVLLREKKWADFRTDYAVGLHSLLEVLTADS